MDLKEMSYNINLTNMHKSVCTSRIKWVCLFCVQVCLVVHLSVSQQIHTVCKGGVRGHHPCHPLTALICCVANECIEENLNNKLCLRERKRKKRNTWISATYSRHSVAFYLLILCKHIFTPLLIKACALILGAHNGIGYRTGQIGNEWCDYCRFDWISSKAWWLGISTEPHASISPVWHLHTSVIRLIAMGSHSRKPRGTRGMLLSQCCVWECETCGAR